MFWHQGFGEGEREREEKKREGHNGHISLINIVYLI